MSATATRDRALTLLAFSHSLTQKALNGIPESKSTYQQSPTDDHAIWTAGHLATTYAWFKSVFDGAMYPLPDSYNALFGMGSKPNPDAKAYPPIAEIKKNADAAYDAFIAAAKRLSDADLAKAPATDTGGFCSDKLDALDKAAWHEGWHCGQLCGIRKSLGLPSVF